MLRLLSLQEVEMLAGLLARAGTNVYEAAWANEMLDRLRLLAESALATGGDDDDEPNPPGERK